MLSGECNFKKKKIILSIFFQTKQSLIRCVKRAFDAPGTCAGASYAVVYKTDMNPGLMKLIVQHRLYLLSEKYSILNLNPKTEEERKVLSSLVLIDF